MPLVTSHQILINALKGQYAIGAFNVNNLEMVQAVIEAGIEENSPIILQFSQGAINYIGIDTVTSLVKAFADHSHIPVVLHFDHGTSVEQNILCLVRGFTSLMFDGSSLSIEDNIIQTAAVCRVAHLCGIPVEAELGKVLQKGVTNEEIINMLTDPGQARDFIKKTNVNSLAVAIGSVHAQNSNESELDIDRLKQIKREIPNIPLVLHGSSGVNEDCIRQSIKNGICKINVGTCLIEKFSKAVKIYIEEHPDIIDPRKYLNVGKEAMKNEVKHKIRLFGSNNVVN
jgi:fructose-bisphosphate aldolase, class II